MFRKLERYLPYLFLLALIVWGAYVTFVFIGTDGHIAVLLKDSSWKEIAREVRLPFYRGLSGLVPLFAYFGERAKPFLAYGVISVLLYGIYVAYEILKHGRLYIDRHFSAAHVILAFIFSLWLIFTTLFYAPIPNLQPRLTLEPIRAALNKSVSDEALSVLQDNFQDLKNRGCLREDPMGRKSKAGARVYWYRGWCAQRAFITRVVSQAAMLVFFIVNFLVLGRGVFRLMRLESGGFEEFVIALGLGAAVLTMMLWFFALTKILSGHASWALLLIVPIVGYRNVIYWARAAIAKKWRFRSRFNSVAILILWLLVSYIAFNFLTVVRPFPIGWDDLGRYINGPRQVSVFGKIIPGMLAAQWEYLTSLGFLLFGYYSTFGATLAQEINWMSGIFAILAVFACARIVLGNGKGLFAALFYYTLPMVGHFSFADMKTENALMFYGALGLAIVLMWLKDGKYKNARWLFIAGILFAAGIATKPTIVLLLLMAGIVITLDIFGVVSGVGTMLLSTLILTKSGAINLAKVADRLGIADFKTFGMIVTMVLLVLGAAMFLWPLIKDRAAALKNANARRPVTQKTYWYALAMITAGFLAFSVPWMARNVIANGGKPTPSTMLGAPNTITPKVVHSADMLPKDAPPGSRALPPELAIDPNNQACVGTSEKEELDRYWGYGHGLVHFVGLPWRVVMNEDSQGYYLTTSPLLLLVPLLLLLPMFWKNRLLRLVLWGTLAYVIQWTFAASGIPWYGIGMFLGLAICVEAIIVYATDGISKVVGWMLFAISISIALSLRLWQFSMQMNLHEYSWGKASYEVMREVTIPDYDDIAQDVVRLSKNPDTPFLYRMGTFISYFIPHNRKIIPINDNQLGFFNCINQEEDHKLTLKRLHALGFHSIVFDTNTATIEKDPNGTLHQKVNKFLDFANDPDLGIVSVVNNSGGGIAYMILPADPNVADKSGNPGGKSDE